MKNVKVESKKVVKAAKPRRVAGVQVRSGVKAGYGQLSTGPGQGYTSLFGTQH